MKSEIDQLLLELLDRVTCQLKQAVLIKDFDWAYHEIEFMHNIPGLIDKNFANLSNSPLTYFWTTEVPAYLSWAFAQDDERKDTVKIFYMPLLRAMEPILQTVAVPGLDINLRNYAKRQSENGSNDGTL